MRYLQLSASLEEKVVLQLWRGGQAEEKGGGNLELEETEAAAASVPTEE